MKQLEVYIIDDEQQTLDLLSEFVRLMGCNAKVFISARDFFSEEITVANKSIMILDLNMPDMDGIQVMRKMVETGHIMPLILISGYDSGIIHSAEQLAKAYSLNIITTLSKPFNFDDFKQALNSYTLENGQQEKSTEQPISVSELSLAIKEEQLILFYQPQIDISSGSLIGVEALVYWQHPRLGLVSPGLFISLAENNGLIGDLTALVIKKAMQQALYWKSKKLMIQVSVNISADNITSLSLPEQLSDMLDGHQLDPNMLTLELTESALMGELITSLDILTRLRMKGIELSIDDFGTGYSSLSQLYRMPFTELKIDQSFVMNMKRDEEARGIVKTCIMLGHELKMNVVAEGVEDKQTLEILSDMGCDIAQGYYIAKPMPAKNLIPWIQHREVLRLKFD